MNIQEYLASGALEAYALGLGSDAERRETEKLLAEHPALQAELQAIQAGLEVYATVHAVQPPDALKSRVMAAIAASEETSTPTSAAENSAPQAPKVVSIAPKRFTMAMAAMWALFVVSAGAALFFYNKWQQAEAGYQGLLAEKTQLAAAYDATQARYDAMEAVQQALQAPGNRIIQLAGTQNAPEAAALLAWNPQSGEVKLLANAMPANSTDKQYQLWAIVDGQPQDAGVFDVNDDKMQLLAMKSFTKAQAFAVTIEPRGGSVSPTLSTMVVLGEV